MNPATVLRLLALSFLTMTPLAASVQTGYAPVNGLQLYYEIHGPADAAEPPLMLLHGGGDTIETSFGEVLPLLARRRRIVAFEQQGCGHTADIAERPFSFEQSADDTAALLRHLGIARADLVGFSNGGTIALQVAIRHPGVVRKLVLISTLFSRAGAEPGFWASMQAPDIAMMPPELKAAYLRVAPHPENFRLFFEKSARRMRDFADIPEEKIRHVTVPALIINGDRDVVRPEQAVALFRLLPQARVAVLPATDHLQMMHRTEQLVPMIDAFLAAPEAK